jgi:hypothetical protein
VVTSRDILGPADATGVVLTVAAAFADNNPRVVRVLIAAMAFIAADPAAVYLKAEPAAKSGRDEVAEILRDGTMIYAVTSWRRRTSSRPRPLIHGRDGG